MILLKFIGVVLGLAAFLVAGFVGDMTWNGGQLFYAVAGRDTLIDLCTPPTREDLVGKGFSPVDILIDGRPSIGFASGSFGKSKTLSAPFTFSDGPNGQRVDGHLVCSVRGKAVTVEVEVDSLPVRAA